MRASYEFPMSLFGKSMKPGNYGNVYLMVGLGFPSCPHSDSCFSKPNIRWHTSAMKSSMPVSGHRE